MHCPLMDSRDIQILETGSVAEVSRVLQHFNSQHNSSFSFSGISAASKKRLGEVLARKIADPLYLDAHARALELLRLLARDKNNLEDLISDQLFEVLTIRARLAKEQQGTFPTSGDNVVTTEAQKVLCNLVFHSKSAQRYFSREETTDVLMSRISANKELAKWPLENQLLDMKLLFIITILCADTRSHFRNDLHAIQDLCVMATMLTSTVSSRRKSNNGTNTVTSPEEGQAANIVCEILKVLFNLVCNISTTNLTLGEEMDFVNLGSMARELLVTQESEEIKKVLITVYREPVGFKKGRTVPQLRHVINLLTVVKKFGYNQMISPISDESDAAITPFQGCELQAVDVVLRYLDAKLSPTPAVKCNDDSIAPILCALTEMSKALPIVRKYLKLHILPPLRDVHTRPEVGSSLRNKICRLLTSPTGSVRDSAGDLLYILCKNNAQRLIKYTGYGNAAGWMAERGLMGLGRSQETQLDDTDPSDTEEYNSHQEKIDPITGVIRVEGPEPMVGMTDEQKEAAAVDLVNALHRMLDMGSFKPATIGPDGRPRVISNVHEFRDEILKDKNVPEEKASSDEEQ